jgi:hypothetical protein
MIASRGPVLRTSRPIPIQNMRVSVKRGGEFIGM